MDMMSRRKARHFALYRIKGMVKNLLEIDMDVPMSDQEHELAGFAREVLQELVDKWGMKRWSSVSRREAEGRGSE